MSPKVQIIKNYPLFSQIEILKKCVTLSREILQRRTQNDKREGRAIFRIL